MSVFIIIPAYNEENRVGSVIAKLLLEGYKNIIVVDDGSKDKTADVAEQAGALVLRHVVNRGQGASLKTGIDYALEKKAKYIVTFDADGQHRVEDIKQLIKPVLDGSVDISVGSRFLLKEAREKMPFKRRFLLRGSVIVQNVFYGVKLTDVHSGLRAMTREAAQKIKITTDRMDHASEIIEEIKKNNLKYVEVPVIVNYSEELIAKGHGGYVQAIKVFLNMIMKKLAR